jgi:hypothetical protein
VGLECAAEISCSQKYWWETLALAYIVAQVHAKHKLSTKSLMANNGGLASLAFHIRCTRE